MNLSMLLDVNCDLRRLACDYLFGSFGCNCKSCLLCGSGLSLNDVHETWLKLYHACLAFKQFIPPHSSTILIVFSHCTLQKNKSTHSLTPCIHPSISIQAINKTVDQVRHKISKKSISFIFKIPTSHLHLHLYLHILFPASAPAPASTFLRFKF